MNVKSNQYYRYIDRKYEFNNPHGLTVEEKDLCIVHHQNGVQVLCMIFLGFANSLDIKSICTVPINDLVDAVLYEDLFARIEPIHWWRGSNKNINSPEFKAMAELTGIKKEEIAKLPGYIEEPIISREYKVTMPKSVFEAELMKQGMQIHLPQQFILIDGK